MAPEPSDDQASIPLADGDEQTSPGSDGQWQLADIRRQVDDLRRQSADLRNIASDLREQAQRARDQASRVRDNANDDFRRRDQRDIEHEQVAELLDGGSVRGE